MNNTSKKTISRTTQVQFIAILGQIPGTSPQFLESQKYPHFFNDNCQFLFQFFLLAQQTGVMLRAYNPITESRTSAKIKEGDIAASPL